MSNLKVEGKVADFCPKCKNCKSTTRECNGEKDWLIEVECEDPYDGMIKTLAADSDICCSMFAPKPDRACAKCERFDGTYCHGPNGTITISYKALFGEPVNCPSYSEKKDREIELEDGVSAYEKILNDILNEVYEHPEMFDRNMTAYELLPGRVKTLKDSWDMMCDKYDPLNVENEQRKKTMDNQAKMIQDLKKERDDLILNYHKKFKEKDNKINLLSDYYRTDEKLINNIQKVIFPQEEGSNFTYGYDEILNKVKELKIQSDENKCLKLRNDNQVTMIQGLKLQYNDLSEKLKRVESHDEALTKHFQNDEKLIDNIQKVIFPQEEGSDYTYSYEEILNKVKELKEELEKLKNADISKVPICKEILSTISELKDRNEELEKKLKRQERLNDINADIMPRLILENQRLLTRNRKLQVKLNDILLNPESNRLEEEDK